MDDLIIAGKLFTSRLFVGTGKFSSPAVMAESLESSGTEMVTVALRRVDIHDPKDRKRLRYNHNHSRTL